MNTPPLPGNGSNNQRILLRFLPQNHKNRELAFIPCCPKNPESGPEKYPQNDRKPPQNP